MEGASYPAHQGDNVDPFFEPLTPVIVTDGRSARYEREMLHALDPTPMF